MGTPALYIPDQTVVDVIQDGEELAFVKFPGGKTIWVKSNLLDFDDLVGDDDWGPENVGDDRWNSDDDFNDREPYPEHLDAGDQYDMEYDR